MSEREPTIRLTLGKQEFDMTPSNSELYHYFGALAIWNHIFITQEEEDKTRTGVFIPQEVIGKEAFENLGDTMSNMNFPMRLNQREVLEGDVEVITRILAGSDVDDINEAFPSWLPEV